MLKQQIESVTREAIVLRNRIVIEIHAASFKSAEATASWPPSGRIAFWPVDEKSAQPDIEVVNAIRPAMATIPGSMLLAASSPYSRKGCLWDAYRKYHGKDDAPVFVWQAATRDMNPSVPQSFIDQHMAEDFGQGAGRIFRAFQVRPGGVYQPRAG